MTIINDQRCTRGYFDKKNSFSILWCSNNYSDSYFTRTDFPERCGPVITRVGIFQGIFSKVEIFLDGG